MPVDGRLVDVDRRVGGCKCIFKFVTGRFEDPYGTC
jgi:hypothetical protein